MIPIYSGACNHWDADSACDRYGTSLTVGTLLPAPTAAGLPYDGALAAARDVLKLRNMAACIAYARDRDRGGRVTLGPEVRGGFSPFFRAGHCRSSCLMSSALEWFRICTAARLAVEISAASSSCCARSRWCKTTTQQLPARHTGLYANIYIANALQGEPVLRYKAGKRTQAALLEGLQAQLRAMHTAGATRVFTLHNVLTEWQSPHASTTRQVPADATTARAKDGEATQQPSSQLSDASAFSSSALDNIDAAAQDKQDRKSAVRSQSDEDFEKFLALVQKRGVGSYAVQHMSAHQARTPG